MTHTIQIKKSELEQFYAALKELDGIRDLKPTSKYEAFRLSYGTGTIVGYTSGKIVSNTETATHLVRRILHQISEEEDGIVIGSDEAGKGEWLGPLVVSSVALNSKQSTHLRSFGVRDSKQISIESMQKLKQVVQENSLAFETLMIAPKKFNSLFHTFHSEGKNLNDLLAWAHARVITAVFHRIPVAKKTQVKLVVDEFSRAKTHERIERQINLEQVELVQRPRAEDEIAVAAASIMARISREEWIERESRKRHVSLESLKPEDISRFKNPGDLAKLAYVKKHLKE